MSARFVALEGGEGTGKSTQAARLAEALGALLTREPGGTALGEQLRAMVLDPAWTIGDRAEALLFAAARAQHVDEVIRPALAGGRPVVTDRFLGSSLAYQGVARGLGVEDVRALSAFACAGLVPDVTVLLVVPPEVAAARLAAAGAPPDRMESLGDAFHAQVDQAFRDLAAADPTWVVVDADAHPDTVAARVLAAATHPAR